MSKKNKFILVFGSVGFLVFLFEGSARLAFSIPKVAKRLQANDEYTYRRNWVQEHQKNGMEAYYAFDMYDASKGWIPKPNLRDLKTFDNKTLNTNSRGLRGKRDFPYTKNKDKVRILILGDSFTFGDEVSDDETYSAHLQAMLPHTEIINMASKDGDGGGYDCHDTGDREYPCNSNTRISLPRGKEIALDIDVTQDEAYMFSICHSNEKAKCFSTRPYFTEKIAQGEKFKLRGHWEPAGHRTVAEAIKRYLVDEGHVTVP